MYKKQELAPGFMLILLKNGRWITKLTRRLTFRSMGLSGLHFFPPRQNAPISGLTLMP